MHARPPGRSEIELAFQQESKVFVDIIINISRIRGLSLEILSPKKLWSNTTFGHQHHNNFTYQDGTGKYAALLKNLLDDESAFYGWLLEDLY